MAEALLVRFFHKLPKSTVSDDPTFAAARMQEAVQRFRTCVRRRYTEGTLQRLLASDDPVVRRAAVLALGLVGTMASNALLAGCLHDEDPQVRAFAGDALWEVWFRGADESHARQLQNLSAVSDFPTLLAALDDLIRSAPDFAEAWNQRAILLFRRGEYQRAITDCEEVLKRNPYHFGAQAGLGQCLLKLRRPQAALRAFERALEINPNLEHLRESVNELRAAIRRREDRESA